MAIKLDGHITTALKLKASDGSEVIKQLSEEGTIPVPTETLDILSNGLVDVEHYKNARVQVPTGGGLPALDNPASASDILSGKEAIDGDGAKLVGTCTFDADTSDADAIASDIAQGKTAYVNGAKVTGTASGGGFDYLAHTNGLSNFYKVEVGRVGALPETLVINAPNAVNFLKFIQTGGAAQSSWTRSGCKHLTLNVKSFGLSSYSEVFINQDTGIEDVTINTENGYGSIKGCAFAGCTALREINGIVFNDYHSTNWGTANPTANNPFAYCVALEEVRFAPNLFNADITFKAGAVSGVTVGDNFSNATLVSIGNSLKGQHTLTLSAVAKAKLATITGTVSQVTDGDVTYDLFTESASGTISLESFIMTTKGWTLG